MERKRNWELSNKTKIMVEKIGSKLGARQKKSLGIRTVAVFLVIAMTVAMGPASVRSFFKYTAGNGDIAMEMTRQDVVTDGGDLNSGAASAVLDCEMPMRFGDAYGGWGLCRPLNETSLRDAIVYTVGIGRNIGWDEEMLQRFSTIHHGWDPTPTAIDYFQKRDIPDGFHFHKYGLAATNGNMTLKLPEGNHDSYTVMEYKKQAQAGTVVEVPMLTVESMMQMLSHKWLAVLKMDIEGAEFDVIDAWYADKYVVPADQVLVEFHERYYGHEAGSSEKVPNAVRKMSSLGFDLVLHTKMVRFLFSFHMFSFTCSLCVMPTSNSDFLLF